jgi:deoxyribodipyrimidine photo-lyase
VRTLVWFRGKDLRLSDHAPLIDAARAGEVVPLFVLDPHFFAKERAAELPRRIQFLLESLAELAQGIERLGSHLLVVKGRSVDVVPKLARTWRCDRVVAHRWSEPFARQRDRLVADGLGDIPFTMYEGETLAPAGSLRTGQGTPFAVYTPFARAFRARIDVAAPLRAPSKLPPLPADVRAGSEGRCVPIPTIEDLGLPRDEAILRGGEKAAHARLSTFVRHRIEGFTEARDRLDRSDGTSRLSADLKFGTISARAVWTRVAEARSDPRTRADAEKFLSELIWREFSHATLWDRPEVLKHPFRRDFEGFPWQRSERGWKAWVEGRTGYPVVDAAARQLLGEGYVHNRARMIAASFLTKDLLIDFRRGEAHYMRWLLDGDWAQNDMGWQWSAGCGVDAQPWFRIFHPVTQGERFDPEGDYVRRWVPELAKVAAKWIHAPWTAPPLELAGAGVRIGRDYPEPIVDHKEARERFLAVAKGHLGDEWVNCWRIC